MIGEQYGHSLASYTSPSPLGPFSLKKTMTPVYGDPGDVSTFVDDDGKAYLVSAAAPVLSSAEVSRLLRRYTTATPAL